MREIDQVKAIAELDGNWLGEEYPDKNIGGMVRYKDYLTSRDAIIPVIDKQGWETKRRIGRQLREDFRLQDDDEIPVLILCRTPRQLCEALLRATGKWKV